AASSSSPNRSPAESLLGIKNKILLDRPSSGSSMMVLNRKSPARCRLSRGENLEANGLRRLLKVGGQIEYYRADLVSKVVRIFHLLIRADKLCRDGEEPQLVAYVARGSWP